MTPLEVQAWCTRVSDEIGRVLKGQTQLIEHVLWALLARGHVLIEGVPGLGKTLLVRALCEVLGLQGKRIQFTPDLMPSDVSGCNIYSQRDSTFAFVPGPVFAELVLADEVNRAPPKTQASLLEAMQDRSVTTDGVTRQLPAPFVVLATQNPVESQGTYPLPEAQLDRFLMKISVTYPSRADERRILESYLHGFDPTALAGQNLARLATPADIVGMQRLAAKTQVEGDVLDYMTDLVTRTRQHRSIYLGASPRASIALLTTAQARAISEGRDFVTPDDVKTVAPAVLRHRLLLHADAELEDVTADQCIAGILRDAVVPRAAD